MMMKTVSNHHMLSINVYKSQRLAREREGGRGEGGGENVFKKRNMMRQLYLRGDCMIDGMVVVELSSSSSRAIENNVAGECAVVVVVTAKEGVAVELLLSMIVVVDR
jgi:hypothetical protein